jgi:hypothetical protein
VVRLRVEVVLKEINLRGMEVDLIRISEMNNVYFKRMWSFLFGADFTDLRFFFAGGIKSGLLKRKILGYLAHLKNYFLNPKKLVTGPLDHSKGPALEFGLFQKP